MAKTLNAVGGPGDGEDGGTSRLGREENPASDIGVLGVTACAAVRISMGLV